MFDKYIENRESNVDLDPGAIIFHEGDFPDSAYIVIEGTVNLNVKGEELTSIESGDVFGEMALIDNSPRFATAAAGGQGVKLFKIDTDAFINMIKEDPQFALDIMRVMSDRLRKWGGLFE